MYHKEIKTGVGYSSITAELANRSTEKRSGLDAISDCLRNYNTAKDTSSNGSAAVSFDEAGIYRPNANRILRFPEHGLIADVIHEHNAISPSEEKVAISPSEKESLKQTEMADTDISKAGSFYENLGEVGILEEFLSGAYELADMAFIGQYAETLKDQIEDACYVWGTGKPDSELGKAFAAEKQYIQELAGSAGISSKAEELVNRVFLPYIDRFLDALDKAIDGNRKKEYPWLFRTTDIDRDAVYSAYQSALLVEQNK